jgi:hypothetical protein
MSALPCHRARGGRDVRPRALRQQLPLLVETWRDQSSSSTHARTHTERKRKRERVKAILSRSRRRGTHLVHAVRVHRASDNREIRDEEPRAAHERGRVTKARDPLPPARVRISLRASTRAASTDRPSFSHVTRLHAAWLWRLRVVRATMRAGDSLPPLSRLQRDSCDASGRHRPSVRPSVRSFLRSFVCSFVRRSVGRSVRPSVRPLSPFVVSSRPTNRWLGEHKTTPPPVPPPPSPSRRRHSLRERRLVT